ncbi:hypothetical protein F5882DRAFT_461093 [Hyaloscypha sp. PMI_1271]|nr:hypothetical protein F5882DRAFT_461093 [Hyaloscypha sp. PMI_1271]
MVILFQDLSSLAWDGTTDQTIEATATVFYIYASPIMPQFAFNKLQETITTTASILKAGRQSLSWVYLLEKDFPLFIQALTVWQGEALALISSSDFISQIQRHMRTNMKQWPAFWSNTSTVSRNGKVFCSAAILLPSLRILQMQEAELMGLVTS